MFYGEYKHTIDTKGRLFIPAKLREKLGDNFILSRGFDKCVCVYPEDEWERFTAKIEELPFAKERRVRRYFYAYSEDGSIDAQGRLGIQGNGSRDKTEINISGDATVYGLEAGI